MTNVFGRSPRDNAATCTRSRGAMEAWSDDVSFVPNGGMLEFRIPLTDRYVREHRAELQRRADAKPLRPQTSRRSSLPNARRKSPLSFMDVARRHEIRMRNSNANDMRLSM